MYAAHRRMRTLRWLTALLACLLLLGALPLPAHADDDGNQVILVDIYGDQPLLEPLLSAEEQDLIYALQEPQGMLLLSDVSPDDTTVVAAGVNFLPSFLNIEDGSSTVLPLDFSQVTPLPFFDPVNFRFHWLNERTVVVPVVVGGDFLALVTIDRFSSDIDGFLVELPGFLLSFAPNGSGALLAIPVAEGEPLPDLFSLPLRQFTNPGQSHEQWLPATLRAQVAAVEQKMSPDLKQKLAVMRNDDRSMMQVTSEETLLAVVNFQNGDITELTRLAAGTSFLGSMWSPDSNRVALSTTGVDDQAGSRAFLDGALLSSLVYQDVTGQLAPEQNPFLQNSTLQLFDLAAGTSSVVRAADSDEPIFSDFLAWSPDGQTLMAKMWHPSRLVGRTYPIYTLGYADSSSFRFFNTALEEVGRVAAEELSAPFSSNGSFASPDEVIFSSVVGTNVFPFYYNRVSGEFRLIADRAGTYGNGYLPGQVVATHVSRQIVFPFTSFTQPSDMYRQAWDGSAFARITWSSYEYEQLSNTRFDPVAFRGLDGRVYNGVLIQPADAAFPPRDVPIIVWQEGGPGGAITNRWAGNVENPFTLLPNFGFALLVVPLQSREGHGPGAINALADGDNFGQIDIDSMAAIVERINALGWTSPGKVGITGCSYGGYFTLQSIQRHPYLYSAANAQCALIDLPIEWSRGYDRALPYLMGSTPFEAPEEYRRDSPIYNASRIRTPLLTFHGTDDFLPVTQNENLHLQVLANGTAARMLKFANEGHGLANPDNQAYAAQEQIVWFRTYLQP